MTKQLLYKNLDESLAQMDLGIKRDDLDFIVKMGYEQMKDWTYRDFSEFASEVSNEWGDYLYIMRQYDMLPDLIEDKNLVNDWFSDHEQAMRDCLIYCDMLDVESELSGDELYDLFDSADSDLVVEWLTDNHDQAYKDCLLYVKEHK